MSETSNAPETIWAQCTAHQNWQDPIATNVPVEHFVQYTRTDAITPQQAAKVLLKAMPESVLHQDWIPAKLAAVKEYLKKGEKVQPVSLMAAVHAALRAIAEQEDQS